MFQRERPFRTFSASNEYEMNIVTLQTHIRLII